jgi:hypothetical protein
MLQNFQEIIEVVDNMKADTLLFHLSQKSVFVCHLGLATAEFTPRFQGGAAFTFSVAFPCLLI